MAATTERPTRTLSEHLGPQRQPSKPVDVRTRRMHEASLLSTTRSGEAHPGVVVASAADGPIEVDPRSGGPSRAQWEPVGIRTLARRSLAGLRIVAAASSPPATHNPAAISRAIRATSLLTAEATPACSGGAAASTVEVRGATLMARPSP